MCCDQSHFTLSMKWLWARWWIPAAKLPYAVFIFAYWVSLPHLPGCTPLQAEYQRQPRAALGHDREAEPSSAAVTSSSLHAPPQQCVCWTHRDKLLLSLGPQLAMLEKWFAFVGLLCKQWEETGMLPQDNLKHATVAGALHCSQEELKSQVTITWLVYMVC